MGLHDHHLHLMAHAAALESLPCGSPVIGCVTGFAELLLMRVDKMSMGVSLEGRVPFLDHKFVELAMSIPESVKTRNGNLKHILKKSVRGVIPDELIDRKKQGFGVPLASWVRGPLREVIRDIFADPVAVDTTGSSGGVTPGSPASCASWVTKRTNATMPASRSA